MLDVFEILKQKIAALPEGDHLVGLRAVQLHTQTAIRHYNRGQAEQDETAFTDSIYRCNQAFEGSAKEAYRVLAGKDPEKQSPYKIEEYLAKNNVLRERVLAQFKNYRTEWRNPSTHNYKLDFDEDEALLAITSVAVFSIVLCDQILEKLAMATAKKDTPKPKSHVTLDHASARNFSEVIAQAVADFGSTFERPDIAGFTDPRSIYLSLASALTNYLANAFPGLAVEMEKPIADGRLVPDIYLSLDGNVAIIEIGFAFSDIDDMVTKGVDKLSRYMLFIPEASGILFVYSLILPGRYETVESATRTENVRVVRPITSPVTTQASNLDRRSRLAS